MREVVRITIEDVMPSPAAVLAGQGIPGGTAPNERIQVILDDALGLLAEHAAPTGILAGITIEEFAAIYPGEGQNAPETPLAEVYPRADHLALFAITLGPAMDAVIKELFDDRDYALGAMLDSAASEAADRTGDVVADRFLEILRAEGGPEADPRLLRYSPGYCGWHVSGQLALFEVLRPGEIGITLRESCLMEPLKSISGVIVGGRGEIHDFDDAYDFCLECSTRECRQRIEDALTA